MSSEPAMDQNELTVQVQRLAGRAFLNCLALEESLKSLLSLMAQMRVGDLIPEDAKGILDGQKRLTSGQASARILQNTQQATNFDQLLDVAIRARNELVHQLPCRCWMVKNASEFQALAATAKGLTKEVADGVDVLRLMIRALIEVLVQESPHLITPEQRSQLEQLHLPGKLELTVTYR